MLLDSTPLTKGARRAHAARRRAHSSASHKYIVIFPPISITFTYDSSSPCDGRKEGPQ